SGAEAVATGHYARIEKGVNGVQLIRAIDSAKDQTYFLYRLNQSDLSRAFFPIGGLEKPAVRKEAQRFGLPNAQRPDSQGLCFVGDFSMPEFLGRFIKLEKGQLVDENNAPVGVHDGAALYTIGQRHGFHLAQNAAAGPYYVTSIDVAANTVHV